MLAHYPSTINPTFTLIKYSLSVNINTSLEMKKIKIIQTVAVNVYQQKQSQYVRLSPSYRSWTETKCKQMSIKSGSS